MIGRLAQTILRVAEEWGKTETPHGFACEKSLAYAYQVTKIGQHPEGAVIRINVPDPAIDGGREFVITITESRRPGLR